MDDRKIDYKNLRHVQQFSYATEKNNTKYYCQINDRDLTRSSKKKQTFNEVIDESLPGMK